MSDEILPTTPPPPPEPILDPSRAPAPPPERLTFFTVVLQFFLIPVGIVAACAAIFLGLRAVVGQSKSPDELLVEVREGGVNRRWQAAFELSQVLSQPNPPSVEADFVDKVAAAFQKSSSDDSRIQEYLALILGSLRDKRGTPALLVALPGAGPTLRFNILMSLGAIGDPAGRTALLDALRDAGDAGVRKVALFGLSRLPKEEATLVEVRSHLTDPVVDVKWNAALVLAAFDDPAGADVLASMLDREALARQIPPGEEGEGDAAGMALRNAISAAARLYQERFRAPFDDLSKKDKDDKVRELAAEALKWLDSRK